MSIRLKVVGAFLLLLAGAAGLEIHSRQFIANISGDAVMINLAGTERYRTVKLAFLSHRYLDKGEIRDRDDIRAEIARYEQVLQGLMHGSKELGLKGVKNPDIMAALREVTVFWEEYKRHIMQVTAETPLLERREALDRIDIEMPLLLAQMDKVTFTLDKQSTGTVERYRQARFYLLFIAVIVGLLLTMEIIRAFWRPMNRLLAALNKVAEGDLDWELKMDRNDEFARVAESFNQMTRNLKGSRKELEKVNRELEDFTYTVSHDLKEPLRSIASFSHFVQEDYKDKLDDEGRDYLQRIVKASARMKHLIDDLLTLSRVGRVRNPFEDVPSTDIVSETLFSLSRQTEEKGVEIKVQEGLPVIHCDRILMQQVFLNLLSNAVKFGNQEHPVVEIGCDTLPDEYRFLVRDNGIGIDGRYHEKIFEIFERLNRKEDYEGTGAGLTIVKKVVEEHHGKVWVESRLGEGSTFYFTIPRATSEEARA